MDKMVKSYNDGQNGCYSSYIGNTSNLDSNHFVIIVSMYNVGKNGWCLAYIGNTSNLDTNHYGRLCVFLYLSSPPMSRRIQIFLPVTWRNDSRIDPRKYLVKLKNILTGFPIFWTFGITKKRVQNLEEHQ